MGAQIIISAINTVFTTIFILIVQLPHASVVIGLTFLCGLLPVIGNLIASRMLLLHGCPTLTVALAIAWPLLSWTEPVTTIPSPRRKTAAVGLYRG